MTLTSPGAPRYRIVETIGRGGMGEVCLADDLMLDRPVALKFVTASGGSGGLELLLDEARAAAALDHPFICCIYEVTALGGRPCIAMEYIRGESLERRLRAGPLPIAEALRVAEEIAEALDAAHRRRVVHCDLKPGNVMLTEDGHIKVMDFGLAARLPPAGTADAVMTRQDTDGVVRGTPAYMAPEQIRGEPADRRSDIFAFGILVYELLTGTNPFVRVGVTPTLAAVLDEPVPPLNRRLPSPPPALDDLLERLLAKDPEARQQSFAEVRTALRRVTVELATSTPAPLPAVIDVPDESITLIGRDVERSLLLQAIDQVNAGRGGMIALLGDAGVGKTRLVEDVLAAARRRGCQTLAGRCYEQDDTPPLIPFIEALEEASRLMPAAVFRRAVGPGAPELAKLMPELYGLFPDMAPPMELPPQLRQRFLFTNLRDFLIRAGRYMPLVLFVDDLQWADGSTLQLAQFLAPPLANVPVVLIVACREVETRSEPESRGRLHSLLDRVRGQSREGHSGQSVRGVLNQLVAQRHARTITIGPFTDRDVQRALEALGRPNPPARLVRGFTTHTGGNPFFVAELFRHLNDEGRLFDAHHQWTRDLDFDDVDVPDTVRTVLERRIQRLSPETLTVLRDAAIIGRDVEPDLLEKAADLDGDRLIAALDEGEQARILKGPSGRRDVTWRFTHPMIRQVLLGGMPLIRRQRLHLRIAEAMASHGEASQVYTAAIAHHLYRAGVLADSVRTAGTLVRAGDAAHAVYATEEALLHYRRALEVLQETAGHDAEKLSVEERLADLLALVGDAGAAMAHYQNVGVGYRGANAAADRARVVRKSGTLHWKAGDRSSAMAAYHRALDDLSKSTEQIEAANLYQELGLAAFRSGDNGKAVEWAERALLAAENALADGGGSDPTRRKAATIAIAQATNTIGVALARSGQLEAARERIERSLATAQDQNLLDVACRAYANLGVLYSTVEPQRAIDVSLTGLEIATKIGAASLQSHIYANLAAAYCALTDHCETEGLEAAQAAAALDRELGQLDHLAVPLIVMAQIYQCRGDLLQAEETYREALAVAEKIDEPQLIFPCYDGLATICLDRGDRAKAEELMETARQLCARSGLDPDTLLLLPFLC